MSEPLISVAQIRRGVLEYRRMVKKGGVTPEIERVEDYLEYRLGACLPIRSRCPRTPEGHQSPEYERVQRLRRAVGWYRLRGQPILRRNAACTIDTAADVLSYGEADGESVDGAIEAIALQIERVRQLRGRGGRYGMLSNGLSSAVMAQVWQYPLDGDLLRDDLEYATEHIAKLVAEALVPYSENSETVQLRQDYWVLQDDGAVDGDFANLLLPEDADLLSIVRPLRLSWRRIAQTVLGIVPNESVAELASIIDLPQPVFAQAA